MKNLLCELLLDHKIKSLVVADCCFNRLFGQIDLFYFKTFLFFKIQKRHRAVSNNTQSDFSFKVQINVFFIAEFERAAKIRKIAVYGFLISLLVPEL